MAAGLREKKNKKINKEPISKEEAEVRCQESLDEAQPWFQNCIVVGTQGVGMACC